MADVKGKDNYDVMPQITGIDIVPSGGTAGQALTKDTGTDYDYSWQDVSTVEDIDDLSDVDTTSNPPSTDNILRWNGSNWVPAMVNELLSGALPALQVRRTSTLALTTSYQDIPWNSTDFENDPTVIEHNNTSTDDIDIKENGLYLIAFNLSIDAGSGVSTFNVRIRKNDATQLPGSLRTISEDDEINDVSNLFVASLNANDKITMQIQSTDTDDVLAVTSTMTIIKQQGAKGDQGETGSGSNINVEDGDVAVTGTPHSTLNFGTGLTATNNGSGQVTIAAANTSPIKQIVRKNITTVLTTSTGMDLSDTPSSSSGVSFDSLAITMTGANTVRVQVIIPYDSDNDNDGLVALVHRGSTVLAVASDNIGKNGQIGGQVILDFYDTPGTGTHTYSIRVGREDSGTTFVNRLDDDSTPWGGTLYQKNCNITLTEMT